MFNIIPKSSSILQEKHLSDYLLIIPTVSVGNVAQLAVDLLVATLELYVDAYVETPYLYPMVGPEPFCDGRDVERGQVGTNCEVFCSDKHKLVIIQQRSPIIKGKVAAFRLELRNWIKEKQFKNVVLLSSSFAHHRVDSQINDPSCRFLCTSSVNAALPAMFQSELGWRILEKNETIAENPYDDKLIIPGGGIATKFYHECLEDGIPLVVLLKFCYEGDNAVDAVDLATFLNSWLRVFPTTETTGGLRLVKPSSWQYLFGQRPSPKLY